jgi:serine protease Do
MLNLRKFTTHTVLALSVAGATLWLGHVLPNAAAVQAQTTPRVSLPDFTELVEQVGPSVVNIRTLEKVKSRGERESNPMEDELFQEFLRRFGIPLPNPPRGQGPRNAPEQGADEQERPRGTGSGFILSNDGFIMTNAHVVDGADEVVVTLTDKREFKARIIGADERTDVAVVKIAATGLPAVRVGDVSKLKVGEWVMAIGSPFGLDNSVTAGIVSAKKRDTGDYLPLIQTDVAINPGNSGGPLINLRGEVVGINSQIVSRSGGYQGISFSIPIDEAVRVGDQLRTKGRVVRGFLGVKIGDVSKEQAESRGLSKPTGAYVSSVERDSPADKAGVQPGDIISKIDGQSVDNSSELRRRVGAVTPGARIKLTVLRKSGTEDLTVILGEADAEKTASAAKMPKSKAAPVDASVNMGFAVAELTAVQKRELKIAAGVRIESVTRQGQQAGLRVGDALLAVGAQEIASVKDYEKSLAGLEVGKPVPLVVLRGDWKIQLMVRPTKMGQ